MDGADGLQELVVEYIFREVRLDAGGQGAADVLVASVGGEGDHAGGGEFFADRGGGLDAGHAGHAEVEKGDVGAVLSIELDRLGTAGRLGDHGHVGLHVDDRGDADA